MSITPTPRATRTDPDERRAAILDAAIEVAQANGWLTMTRRAVAQAAGIAEPTVSRYWPTIAVLRDAVMREAVARDIPALVAQGLVVKHPYTRRLSAEARREALATLGR